MADERGRGARKLLVVVGIVAILLAVVAANLLARLSAEERIREVELEAAQLAAQRDSILAVVAVRDSMRGELAEQSAGLSLLADSLRGRVAALENRRAEQQMAVRMLRTTDATEALFRETFPEVADVMLVTRHPSPLDAGFELEYLMVPTNFVQTFIIDNANSASFQAQRDSLLVLDSLNVQNLALKDSIIHLVDLNAAAYRLGYDSAYAKFEERTAEYIDLLRQPRFKFEVPHLAVIVGAAALGLAIGTRF